MKIYGTLVVSNMNWRSVYANIINYFNEEINSSYTYALAFYNENKELDHEECIREFDIYTNDNNLNLHQQNLIKGSLFSSSMMKKPKRSNFPLFTNRTTYINASSVIIQFDKDNKSVAITTEQFEDFDHYMATNTFIAEFTNLVNTLLWPTRTGPNKTVRGCTLLRESVNGDKIVYYQVGPNPPVFEFNKNETAKEPTYLSSDVMKNVRLTTTEQTVQPIPVPEDLSEI